MAEIIFGALFQFLTLAHSLTDEGLKANFIVR